MTKTWSSLLAVAGLFPLPGQDQKQPVPRFTLAAGAHDVADLVRMVGEARGSPVDAAADVLERAADRRVTLQRELQLDRDEWEDVATALLHCRGLWLAPDASGRMTVVPAAAEDGTGPGAARARTAAEVLARPYRTDLITVRYASKAEPDVLAASLRPLFAGRDLSVGMRADGGDVVCEGRTCGVVVALRLLQLADGAEAPAASTVSWPAGTARAWPGGQMGLDEFLAVMAKALEANVVLGPSVAPATRLTLGGATELAPRAWHAAAARLLRDERLALTVVHGRQRLFEVLPLDGPQAGVQILWRAAVMTASEAADPELPLQPVMTFVPLSPDETRAALRNVRGLRGMDELLTIGSSPRGVVLAGLSDTVAAVVGAVDPKLARPRR